MQAQRHRRIAAIQTKIAAAIAALVAAFTLTTGLVQTHHNSQARQAVATAQKAAKFWRIVGGQEPATNTHPATQLATQLRDMLRQKSDGLPQSITDFKAGANTFGRVDLDLGFNPFDNSGQSCIACGPLTGSMLSNLQAIHDGHLDTVVQSQIDAAPHVHGLTLTPFGVSGYLWYGFLYAAGTISSLIIAIRLDSRRNDYRASSLNWANDGGSAADPFKTATKLVSPLYFVTVIPWQKHRGYGFKSILREINMDKLYDSIKAELAKLDALSPSDQADDRTELLRQKLNQALLSIEQEVAGYDAQAVKASSGADSIRQDIEANLVGIFEELQAREAARRELNGDLPDGVHRLADRRRARQDRGGQQGQLGS